MYHCSSWDSHLQSTGVEMVDFLFPVLAIGVVQREMEKSLIFWQKCQILHTDSPLSTHQNKRKTHSKFLLVAMVTGHFGGKKPNIGDFCHIESITLTLC